METITAWNSTKLRLKVNASKSGIGRPWEGKFLGLCLTQEGLLITASAKSLDRFKARVRELWDARRRGTTEELKEEWQSYLRGWWNYYRLAEWRRPIFSVRWCGRVHGRNPVHSTRARGASACGAVKALSLTVPTT
jgi:RNA-directed DNA polymerase